MLRENGGLNALLGYFAHEPKSIKKYFDVKAYLFLRLAHLSHPASDFWF